MKFIRYAFIDRSIIDTIRYYSLIARPPLSLLIICIRIRSAKESHMKFYYLNKVRYGSVRVYLVNNRTLFSEIKNIQNPV